MYPSPPPAPLEERRRRPRGGPSPQVLIFAVPGVQMCLPLEHVQKVLAIAQLQEVPDAPDYVVGLLNLAGEAIPVVDLCTRLAKPGFDYNLDTPVLLCGHRGRRCGVAVSSVLGVALVDNGQRRMDQVVRDGRAPFLTVFEIKGELTFMLDLEAVCDGLQLDLLSAVDAAHGA